MTLTILTLITIIILRTGHGYYHIKIMCIILSCSCSNNFVRGFKILLDSSKSIFFICCQVTQYQFPIGISFICQLNISYCVWTYVTNWDILNWNIRSETIAIGIIMTWMTLKNLLHNMKKIYYLKCLTVILTWESVPSVPVVPK